DTIWPGFRLQVPAILTFKSGHVLAFQLNSQNSSWKKLSVNGQLALFSETDEWGVLGSPLNQSFSIEGQNAYTFTFDMFENDPFLPFLVFVHERFHQHQAEFFKNDSQIEQGSYDDHLNLENLALIKLEEAILVDYLDAIKTN